MIFCTARKNSEGRPGSGRPGSGRPGSGRPKYKGRLLHIIMLLPSKHCTCGKGGADRQQVVAVEVLQYL